MVSHELNLNINISSCRSFRPSECVGVL